MRMKAKPKCFETATYPEIYSGTPSFMGLPLVREPSRLAEFDVIVMGAPWEGVVTWRGFSGCELAPKAIRHASVRYGGFLPEAGYDVFDYLKAGDYGDAGAFPGDSEKTLDQIRQKASDIANSHAVPITFGGDHSITIPLVDALSSHRGKMGVIHLDAHLDNMDAFEGDRFGRCSPLHRIYELAQINPENVVHMGIRGPRNNPIQLDIARQAGAAVITAFEIKRCGIVQSAERAIQIARKNTNGIYVTVCSDVLDVAFNPGGPPDFCGMSSSELAWLLYRLGAGEVMGFDYVEVYPTSDPNHVSSHAAVWMTIYLLSGMVRHRYHLKMPDAFQR
jgi:agmatinase